MEKYVDINACVRYLLEKIGLFSTVSLETVIDHIADYADHNSADVAPRAEVERETIDFLCELHDHFKSVGDIREAFAMLFAIAELKKKYTEEGK